MIVKIFLIWFSYEIFVVDNVLNFESIINVFVKLFKSGNVIVILIDIIYGVVVLV